MNDSSPGPRDSPPCKRRSSQISLRGSYATILSCSDSRVPPELIFDAGLGELFIIRVAGNVLSPEIGGVCNMRDGICTRRSSSCSATRNAAL
jgi:hypothetical protein